MDKGNKIKLVGYKNNAPETLMLNFINQKKSIWDIQKKLKFFLGCLSWSEILSAY